MAWWKDHEGLLKGVSAKAGEFRATGLPVGIVQDDHCNGKRCKPVAGKHLLLCANEKLCRDMMESPRRSVGVDGRGVLRVGGG